MVNSSVVMLHPERKSVFRGSVFRVKVREDITELDIRGSGAVARMLSACLNSDD